jgi:hypothetical protein
VLAARRAQPGDAARLYDDCRVFADYREMLETCRPDAVWVGVPPVVHGSLSGGKDIELQVRANVRAGGRAGVCALPRAHVVRVCVQLCGCAADAATTVVWAAWKTASADSATCTTVRVGSVEASAVLASMLT